MRKLKGILAEMRFKDAPPRKIVMTYEQVIAFIQKAHELGRPELALAQALQFEGTLRQIDVIGEWVPDPERPSGTRWANGLLWSIFATTSWSRRPPRPARKPRSILSLSTGLRGVKRVPPDRRSGR